MKLRKKQYIQWSLLFILCIGSIYFVFHNHHFYDKTIGEVVKTTVTSKTPTTDQYDNKDTLYTQRVTFELKNGDREGQLVTVDNDYSASQANDDQLKKGTEAFLTVTADQQSVSATIDGIKRDKYLAIIAWMLILVLLAVGKRQGFFSIITLGVNACILSFALDLYITKAEQSLLLICSICMIIFTVFSLLVVNGLNRKTIVAIIATLLGTVVSLAITLFVLNMTNEHGLRYEELQFLTRPYKVVFIAGLFLGALGAVMDVAITMSSSLFSLYEENPTISMKALIKSGMEIGKDIMGTMTNILFFAYVSGSIPMLVLYFKNTAAFGYTLSLNLSLEIVRALAGGIGIVITIPIGLYVTILFILKSKKVA